MSAGSVPTPESFFLFETFPRVFDILQNVLTTRKRSALPGNDSRQAHWEDFSFFRLLLAALTSFLCIQSTVIPLQRCTGRYQQGWGCAWSHQNSPEAPFPS